MRVKVTCEVCGHDPATIHDCACKCHAVAKPRNQGSVFRSPKPFDKTDQYRKD